MPRRSELGQQSTLPEILSALEKNSEDRSKLKKQTSSTVDLQSAAGFKPSTDADKQKEDQDAVKHLTSLAQALEAQKKTLEGELYALYQVRLGGLTTAGKSTTNTLELPSEWDKTNATFIKDPIRLYLEANTCDYFAIIPRVQLCSIEIVQHLGGHLRG